MNAKPSPGGQRIISITFDEESGPPRTPEVEHERRVAVFDLVDDNHFAPVGLDAGPYCLHLAVEENRLVFDLRDANERPLDRFVLPVSAFRRLIKDYFTVCDSYFEAIKMKKPSQIEAIDMGRRSLHDEGSILLCELLADKVDIEFETARRLFTLLCALRIRG